MVSRLFLEKRYNDHHRFEFIENDPISVPHRFSKKDDIEIAGLFASVLAWGQRQVTIRNALKLMEMMDHAPHDFMLHHRMADLKPIKKFVHRTFNGEDAVCFIRALKNVYLHHGGMEKFFTKVFADAGDAGLPISEFRKIFFSLPHQKRTEKHLPDPLTGSAAKRMNMFLRWMVRPDDAGIDFGIWKKISPAKLVCPLDVHSANNARRWGLLTRKQNDWKAAMELTMNLRKLDAADPVRFDFALFGDGVWNSEQKAGRLQR
jgi:uncharacterized protein (TIGR02757 family)